VTWGITTSRAHLDTLDPDLFPLDPAEPAGREIDWNKLFDWMWSPPAPPSSPSFAGRYFLGEATDSEANDGTPFCLWAHGEAAGIHAPKQILPIQRADPVRQAATGTDGLDFGRIDAIAIASHLDRCLAVGDLEVVDTTPILVFLEVADGTQLSIEYWAAWASNLHDALLEPARQSNRNGTAIPLLLPAVLCAHAFDEDAGAFLPELAVRDTLDTIGPPGYRTHCHGLWARRLVGDPGLANHAWDWSTIGEYRQRRTILGLATPYPTYLHLVPVRYLRWFDSPDGLPIPAGALHDTLSLLTIEWSANDGDDPVAASFMATPWSANRRDGSGKLLDLPSQLGIDMSKRATASAACLGRAPVTVKSLPYNSGGMAVNLTGRCAFAVRYYRPALPGRAPTGRPLTVVESAALSANGVQVAACWQHTADLNSGWVPYVNGLESPFVTGLGRKDGTAAFVYAAETIGQPPYTPVYFSVDFPLNTPRYFPWNIPYYVQQYKAGDPNNQPVATLGLAPILDYFADIRRGYRDYLTAHPETTPYYVGVYCDPRTAAALYRVGLVSHFWQPAAVEPFPHLNVWQVGMDGTPGVASDNAALQACAPPGGARGGLWVDVNVAWGDPGVFG
jgi:hypothetical protein